MLVVALSCLSMVLEEEVLICKGCLWMKRFLQFIVILGRPDLRLSWTLPMARKHWFSLHMTEWETPKSSGHFSFGNVVLEPCNGLSPFKVSQLSSWRHDQNRFDCSQMPPIKTTNVTTFHTQGQLLHVHVPWKWYANSATPTHCSTRIHNNFVSLENKTEFIHTWNDHANFHTGLISFCV